MLFGRAYLLCEHTQLRMELVYTCPPKASLRIAATHPVRDQGSAKAGIVREVGSQLWLSPVSR